MPQKGQIKKHEWPEFTFTGKWVSTCPHCGLSKKKRTYESKIFYYSANGVRANASEKCITRKITDKGHSAAT